MPPRRPYCKCRGVKVFIEERGQGVLVRCPKCGKESINYSKSAYRWLVARRSENSAVLAT